MASETAESIKKTNIEIEKLTENLGKVYTNLSTIGGKVSLCAKSFMSMFKSVTLKLFSIDKMVKGVGKSIESTADSMEAFNYYKDTFAKLANSWSGDYKKYGYENAEAYADSFTSRMEETFAKLSGVQFDDESLHFASTGVKNLGLNIQDVTKYAAQLAGVSDSIELTGESTLSVSSAFAKLAGDLSSVYNVDYNAISKDLQNGLEGQAEALSKYGIELDDATLQTYAYKTGIGKAVSEMTEAEKTQLRMVAILKQSESAWGNLANGIDAPSNQIRLFKNNISELEQMLGQLFMPMLEKVMPFINGIAIAVKEVLGNIAAIFGIQIEYNAKSPGESIGQTDSGNGENEISVGTVSMSEGLLQTIEEYESVWNEAYEQMESRAQEFAEQIAVIFVPIEKLFSDIKIGDWDAASSDVSNIISGLFNSFSEAIANVDWRLLGESIGLFLVGINWIEVLSSIGDAIGGAIEGAFDLYKWTFDAAPIETAIITAVGALKFLGVGKKISEALSSDTLWKNLETLFSGKEIEETGIFSKLGNMFLSVSKGTTTFDKAITACFGELTLNVAGIASIVGGGLLAVVNFIDMLNEGFNWLNEMLMILGIGLVAVGAIFFGATVSTTIIFAALVAAIATVVVVVKDNWDSIVSWTLDMVNNVAEFFQNLWNAIVEIWSNVSTWFSENIIQPIVDGFADFSSRAGQLFEGLWSAIQEIWRSVSTWMDENVIQPIAGFFEGLSTRVEQIFEELWGVVQAVWTVASTWVNENVIQPIVGFFEGLFTRVGQIFEGLWIIVQAIWKIASTWMNENVIQPIVNFFTGLYTSISQMFEGLWTYIQEIWGLAVSWMSENVIQPIVNFFVGLYTSISQVFEGLWTYIQEIWGLVVLWMDESVIQPIVGFFTGLFTSVGQVFTDLWLFIQTVWETASAWFNENIIIPITTFFSDMVTNISQFFENLWLGIQTVWFTVLEWFNVNIIAPLSSAFETVCSSISGFFTGLWDGIKRGVVGAMNAVIGGIESAINFIVGGINAIIGGFNKVVSWAADVAEVEWGGVDLVPTVTLARVPEFEVGGFPEDGLFMANHGELVGKFSNGKTAVANNEQIVSGIKLGVREAVSEVLAPYLADIAQNTRETANKDFATYIGDKEIARASERGRRAMGLQLITEF